MRTKSSISRMKLSRLLLASLDTLKPLCTDTNLSVYKRTLDHLHSWRLVLPESVKGATYHLNLNEKEEPHSPHWGAWMFLYENIPQLKYHNPMVEFNIRRHFEGDSRIEILSGDGAVETLLTTGLKQNEIREQLETLVDG